MPNVLPKTTVETLKGGTNGKITVVYDLEGNVVSDTENVGTGYKVVADGKEYTVIVKGDLDGDGAISTTDYYRIKMSLLGDYQLEGIYADSADADKDGKITTTDFMRIKSAFIGDFEL